jgi:GntR family transcriptional regulator of arabinose operon
MPIAKRTKPKHQQVFEVLRRDIHSGRYRAGQKFPSEAALVNRFNVSRITIGRAVHDLQQHGLVERFAGSGTYVMRAADEPREGLLFGLIIPDLGATEIFEPICQGIANSPGAAGHALLWPHADSTTADRERQALQLCEQCIDRRVSGAFFAPIEMTPRATEVNRRVVASLTKAGIPTVLLDRRPEEMSTGSTNRNARCDMVGIDNQRAGFLATEHLLKCGARNIGFVAYRGQAPSVLGRIAGYRQALNRTGHVFQVSPGAPFELPVDLPGKALRFDAFVCANDHLAGHLMLALLAKDVRIPQQVRIVGIDDVMYAALLPSPLTTIHQPCAEIGMTALQLLLERIARPKMPARDVLLDCELVIRKSCGFQVTA